jgi:hypothetical protein
MSVSATARVIAASTALSACLLSFSDCGGRTGVDVIGFSAGGAGSGAIGGSGSNVPAPPDAESSSGASSIGPPTSGSSIGPPTSGGSNVGACEPYSTQCVADMLQTCNDNGTWGSAIECPFLCMNGACGGVCSPGATQCVGDAVQTCESTGDWSVLTSCGSPTPSCIGGSCRD